MKTMQQQFARGCALLALCAPPAFAARPMVADDASILDPGQCQLESSATRYRQRTEYWAVPACNFGGGWELAAGAADIHADGAGRHPLLIQGKTLLRAPQQDGWGVGLVLANQFRPAVDVAGEWSANVPLTVELDGDRLMVHANAGWQHTRGVGGQHTWALGVEKAVGERAAITAETFGSQRGHTHVQLGMRYTLVPGRADFDFGYGDRSTLRGKERYFTMGLTLFAGL